MDLIIQLYVYKLNKTIIDEGLRYKGIMSPGMNYNEIELVYTTKFDTINNILIMQNKLHKIT